MNTLVSDQWIIIEFTVTAPMELYIKHFGYMITLLNAPLTARKLEQGVFFFVFFLHALFGTLDVKADKVCYFF